MARQASKKKPRMFTDYREMLKEKDLDMVEIATPDHWHALPMIEAAKAGADMYLQKPISVDVVEGQAMLAAARKYKRVVQVGTQRRSTPHLIEARDLVQAGQARHHRTRGDLSPTAGPGHCRAARARARHAGLGFLDRPRAHDALQPRYPAQLARLHGVRQRHHRRHGNPHVRHGALVHGPGLAEAHFFLRRVPRS